LPVWGISVPQIDLTRLKRSRRNHFQTQWILRETWHSFSLF
jgi:hypothetical protein